jgi:hypothetical protein
MKSLKYTWLVELATDDPWHDLIDSEYFDTFDEVVMQLNEELPEDHKYLVTLCRNKGADVAWAFIEGGKLPLNFSNIDGDEIAPVPFRFHQQVDKYFKDAK